MSADQRTVAPIIEVEYCPDAGQDPEVFATRRELSRTLRSAIAAQPDDLPTLSAYFDEYVMLLSVLNAVYAALSGHGSYVRRVTFNFLGAEAEEGINVRWVWGRGTPEVHEEVETFSGANALGVAFQEGVEGAGRYDNQMRLLHLLHLVHRQASAMRSPAVDRIVLNLPEPEEEV